MRLVALSAEELDFYNWRSRGFLTHKNGRPTVVFAEEASRLDDVSDVSASAREEALPDELDESVFEGFFSGTRRKGKGSAAAWADGDTTGFPSDLAVDPRETARACVNPEFRELAEWTVEATLFNLVRELEAARAEEAAFDGVGDDAVRWDSAGEDSFEYDGRSEEE